MHQALLERLSQGWKLSPANTSLLLLAPSYLPTPCLRLSTRALRTKLQNFTEVFYLKSVARVELLFIFTLTYLHYYTTQ